MNEVSSKPKKLRIKPPHLCLNLHRNLALQLTLLLFNLLQQLRVSPLEIQVRHIEATPIDSIPRFKQFIDEEF